MQKIIQIELILKFILVSLITSISFNVEAQKKGNVTNLNIPRFVSIKSNDVNLRVGPSMNYPIKIKYLQKNMPIEIIDEYDVWREVKDFHNQKGWIHKSLIKGDRFAIISTNENKKYNLLDHPNGKKIGLIKKNNIVELKKCLISWCLISHSNHKGWILKEDLWGVYKNETYKISYIQPLIEFQWKINLFIKKNLESFNKN